CNQGRLCLPQGGRPPLQPMNEPEGAAPPGLRSQRSWRGASKAPRRRSSNTERATREGGASEGGRGGGGGPEARGKAQPRSQTRSARIKVPRMAARTIRIAVIGGDGIGPEVVAEAIKVLRAAATDVAIETTGYDLGSQRWLRTGETLPATVLSEISGHDAILFGAVGDPSVPSGVLERGLVLRLRFELDQDVNLRPGRV